MKKIQLKDQTYFKPNKKNKLNPSGTISGNFKLIGTYKNFVIASSISNESTYLIKLYSKPKKRSILNKLIERFDNLSNMERMIVMDGYNQDGSINKKLN